MASFTSLQRLVEEFHEKFEPINRTYISYTKKRKRGEYFGWNRLSDKTII